MNEQQTKALFFAQYLHLEVLFTGENLNGKPFYNTMSVRDAYIEKSYLQLRTIDQLTDEERLQLGKMLNGHITESYTDRQIQEVAYRFIHHLTTKKSYVWSIDEVNGALSFLKAIAILIPFTYISDNNEVITLSPDQIIEKGWAVVKH